MLLMVDTFALFLYHYHALSGVGLSVTLTAIGIPLIALAAQIVSRSRSQKDISCEPLVNAFRELLMALPDALGREVTSYRKTLHPAPSDRSIPASRALVMDLSAFCAGTLQRADSRFQWKHFMSDAAGKEWDQRFLRLCRTLQQNEAARLALREEASSQGNPITALHLAINESKMLSGDGLFVPLLLDLQIIVTEVDARRVSHEGLLKLADDSSPNIRSLAIDHLARLGDKPALDMILALLVENDRLDVRRPVSALLVDWPGGELLEVIAIALVDSDQAVRLNAIRALAAMAESDETCFLLEGAMLDTEDVRNLAIGVLAGYRSRRAQNLLTFALDDASPGVRMRAAQALKAPLPTIAPQVFSFRE
jgi:hypothetical protein